MQFIFNLLFMLLSNVFSLFGNVNSPSWFIPLFTDIAEFIVIANHYLPISELASVATGVVAAHLVLMVLSAVLQLL